MVSDCGKYLIVSIVKACRDNLLYFADLEKNGEITGKIPLTPIVTEFEADYDVCFTMTLILNESFPMHFLNYVEIVSSMLPTPDQKWYSVQIKMHRTIA